MQLAVTIAPVGPARLPFFYQQFLSAALYQALAIVQPDFALELHEGKLHQNRIKLFGFSPLRSRHMTVTRGGKGSHLPNGHGNGNEAPSLLIEGEATFRLFSPWPELMSAVGEGLLAGGTLRLSQYEFAVQSAVMVPQPAFAETMTWKPSHESSFVTSWKPRETDKKLYSLPGKPAEGHECSELLKQNLLHKWLRFTDETGRPDIAARWAGLQNAEPAEAKAWLARQNVELTLGEPTKTRLFHIKKIPVRSWAGPVTLTAPIALQRLAWSAGLGEMNSMGFGAVEAG